MRNDEVQDLISQLNDLQLQQTALLARLKTAAADEAARNRDLPHEDGRTREFAATVHEIGPTTREFAIGDKVWIKNPNLFSQAGSGTVTKIGNRRITVTTQSGKNILRAPKNLVLEE
jgi:hypothetical protein